MVDAVVFDIDGTLVDSNYQHLIAWARAFQTVGVLVPNWKLHACMGMGGDHLVAAAAGDVVEKAVGDEVRDLWRSNYSDLLTEVRPLVDATAMLAEVRRLGPEVVLATSGNEDHVERTLEILELRPDEFPLVTSGEAERTKPAPDLVQLALRRVGAASGVMIGDTVWDVRAGADAGVPVIGVLTGGVAPERLREAGAVTLYDDPTAVLAALPGLL